MTPIKVNIIFIVICCLSLTNLFGQSSDYAPNEVLIKWKSSSSASKRTTLKSTLNIKKQEIFPHLGIELLELSTTEGSDVLDLVKRYSNHPDIDLIEPNYFYTTTSTLPNDPMIDSLWGIHNSGQSDGLIGADINSVEGWAIQKESPSIKVAIIDTGVDWGHPDLVDNIWQNIGEDADGDGQILEWDGTKWIFDPGDENGIDDDQNGYIDDFIGWDFANNDNNPYDDHAHGTHVAGIIGAKGNNGIGITGVTWEVQLAPLKFINKQNRGRNSDAIKAINYAVAMGFPISNNSWGGYGHSFFLREAIQQASQQNHLFIAAAGNDNNDNDAIPNYPSAFDLGNIISVAATNNKDAFLSISATKGSNYGATTVDLGAPGHRILSCFPDNSYGLADGTSMAAPFVTGACALLLEENKGKSYSAIKEQILNGVDEIPALNEITVSGGRLNLYKVFEECNVLRDSLALIAFYHALDGPNWKNKWDLSQPMDTWYGVTYSNSGCVTRLAIHNNDLTGKFPKEIGRLSNLQTLSVTGKISGGLPITIGNLTNLQSIYLQGSPQGNQLTDSIPVEIGKLTKLVSLNLQGNKLTGSIPKEIGKLTNLTSLNLLGNDLTGNIPSSIGNLANLQTLYIQENNFTGNIPTTIGNLSDLQILYLNNNRLTGNVPKEIGKLTKLWLLKLENNLLTGTIPREIGKLSNLRGLYLHINQLEGSIPAELGSLPRLSELVLSYNKLSGCFPQSLSNHCNINYDFSNNIDLPNGGNFNTFCNNRTGGCSIASCQTLDSLNLITLYEATNGNNWVNTWDIDQPLETWYGVKTNEHGCVTHILLNNNNLVGTIPTEIGSLEKLTHLHLDNNQLTGIIPSEIGNFSELESLKLNQNQLSGNIPAEIGNLINLERLDLSKNQLTTNNQYELVGNIPIELGNLIHLKWLNLSNNQLGGDIPSILSNLIKLQDLNLANNQLIGSILNQLINLDSLTTISLANNQLTGNIPEALGYLPQLQTIHLANNQFSGCFPASLTNLCSLNYDFLGNPTLPYSGNFDEFCETGIGGCTTCRATDSLALIALYNATDGPNWKNSWQLAQPINTWDGVKTSPNGCVTELRLRSDNRLTGSIPTELGTLASLEVLSLAGQFVDSIPLEIGALSNLRTLSLQGNLTGSIPTELGNLINLQTLIIGRSQLSGSIPAEIGNLTKLRYLVLVDNQLTDSIPSTISKLTNLITLDLSRNQLKGVIPKEIGQLNTTYLISLSNNQLSGSLPKELGNLTRVSRLYLNHNQFSNNIPTELGNLANLQWLYLNNNLLSGTIPSELGKLNRIEKLYLNNNYLTGNLPPELGSFDNLQYLFLNNNLLKGCFPNNFSTLCTIEAYDFSNNLNLPNNGDFNDFCINGAADCQEPVWPGDFNNDGIVNNTDALFWGLACENRPGPQRPNASLEWYAQGSPDWPNAVNNINNKHQDGDGNGFINLADLAALDENYGKENSPSFSTSNTAGVSYRLEPLEITNISDASTLKYALHVEQGGSPVALHGLACTINFGNLVIPEVPFFDTTNSSLIPDQLLLNFNVEENTIDLALTRTDKTNQLCDGAVGVLIVIADHVAVGDPVLLSVEDGHRINADGAFNAVAGTLSSAYATASSLIVSTSIIHEQCDQLGSAQVNLSSQQFSPTFLWSTGATTPKITNLTAGDYSVILTYPNRTSDTLLVEIEGQFLPIYDNNGELQDCGLQTCPPEMTLTNEIANKTHQAINSITANGIINPNNSVTFKAGNSITLQPSFTVTAGATFLATIEDCTPKYLTNSSSSRGSKPAITLSNTTPPPEVSSLNIHPNPFTHQTVIEYDLPSASPVQLIVWDMKESQLKTVLSGTYREAGKHQVTFFADGLEKGAYFVSLQTDLTIMTKKVIIID